MPQPLGDLPVSLRHRVREQMPGTVRLKGEDEGVVVQLDSDSGSTLLAPRTMLGQQAERLRVKDDTAILVGLCVLLPRQLPRWPMLRCR
jgi:hypothetical protein